MFKNSKYYVVLLTVIIILLSLVLIGCNKGTSANKPIQIGFSAPLTGASAQGGQDMVNGAKMAIAAINAAGGILGRQVTLVPEDDACDPATAVQAGNKLVSQGVVAVVGYYCSGAANAALPVYSKANLPVVLAAATATGLTHEGYKNVFRIQGNTDQQGQVAAKVMVQKLHAKRISVINDNTAYSRELSEGTKNTIKQLDPSIAIDAEEITPGAQDFSPIITKIKAFSPDAAYFTGYYSDGALLVKQFRAMGIKCQFLAGDANNDPTFISVAGADAEGVIMTSPPMVEGIPAAAKFIGDYKTQYSANPGAYAVYAYDGIDLVVDAIKRANSTDGSALISAFQQTNNFQAITADIGFDQNGDLTNPGIATLIIKNGQFVPWS